MQINAQTPQATLEQLYRAVCRREMLRSTPLNLRLFLRYALLFVLFPGMVWGFWWGLGITLAFCVALITLLGVGQASAASEATQVWLVCGVCVFLWVCVGSVRSAAARRRVCETARPADTAASATALPDCGTEHALRWRKSAESPDSWQAEVHWQAPAAGIYAALLIVRGMGRRRLLTLGHEGVCTVHSYTTPTGDLQALLLFKLAPGAHTLRWQLLPRAGAPPDTSITLLCKPTNTD